MSLTLNYRPKTDDPTTPGPLREIIGRVALACVGLVLVWLAWRGFHFAGAMVRAYRQANPTAPPKEGGGLAAFPWILSMFSLAFGGLIILGAVLPSWAFWQLLASDEPKGSQRESKLAYAVLHHTGVDPAHYDVLFETSPTSRLASFRAPEWPLTNGAILRHIPDHRRTYLTYEGPVSNGRGEVRRVASGTADHRLWSTTRIHLVLQPGAVDLVLIRQPDQSWLVASVGGQTA